MNPEKLQWRTGAPGKLMSSNEVHVWRMLIDATTSQMGSFQETLSGDELIRANQFYFQQHKKRFIIVRGSLRKILAYYLDQEPAELRFDYTSYGKPVLVMNNGLETLSFNLSHSGEIALLALTRGSNIGIDVECIRDNFDVDAVAHRFFCPAEITSLEKLEMKDRHGLFFQYWCRKEAFIKAIGKGVSFPIEECDVSRMDGTSLAPIKTSKEEENGRCWHVQDLFPGNGYVAAIATEGGDLDISCWQNSL